MKKRIILILVASLILAMLAGSAAAANTNADIFAGSYEKTTLEQMEVWVNGPLIPLMEITDMTVYLWKIDRNSDGIMTVNFIIKTAPMIDHNRFFKTRIEIAVGDGKDFQTDDGGFDCFMKRGDNAEEWDSHYVDVSASNPDSDDFLLHFWIVEVDSKDNPIQGWEIELPIRLAGDYLTGAAGGETHLPILNDELRDMEIPVQNAWVVKEKDFSVCVTGLQYGEGGVSVEFYFESAFQTRPDVSISTNERKVNGESFDGTFFIDNRDDTGNGEMGLVFSNMLSFSNKALPNPIETISFPLIVTDAELAEPFTLNVTLIFDGAVTEPPQAEPSISLDNAKVVHLPVYKGYYNNYVIIIEEEDYGLGLQSVFGDKSEINIHGMVDYWTIYDDDYDQIVTHFNINKINDTQIDWEGWSSDDFQLSVPKDAFPDGEAPKVIESITFSSIEIYSAMENEEGVLIRNNEDWPDYKIGPLMLLFDGND